MVSIRAVSYTHLDVYKRQIQKLSFTKDTVVFIKGLDYAVQNSDSCKEIIFQSGVMKPMESKGSDPVKKK